MSSCPTSLEVYRLTEAGYLFVAAFEGDAAVRAEPFDAIELELGALWIPEPPASP